MIRPNQLGLGYGAVMGLGVAGLGFTPAAFALPTLGMLALLADGIFRASSSVLMPTVTRGPRSGHRIALTFDDGPDPCVTPQILDALAEHGAKATFYCIASHAEKHPALMARIVASGHELGNHSYGHARSLNFRGGAYQQREIEKANMVLRRFAPQQQVISYRPPVGLKNPPLAGAIERLGMPVVAWSLHSRDTRIKDPAAIADRVAAKVRSGDIVVMHDGHDLPGQTRAHTGEAVRLVLGEISRLGLKSVTVRELLGRGD